MNYIPPTVRNALEVGRREQFDKCVNVVASLSNDTARRTVSAYSANEYVTKVRSVLTEYELAAKDIAAAEAKLRQDSGEEAKLRQDSGEVQRGDLL